MERKYESMMVINSEISSEELEGIFDKIKKRIEGLEGKVENAQVWARERNFAYPLRSRGAGRKKHTKGCYWLINFILDTEKLSQLKETIKLEENILRYIIIRREK